MGFIFGMCLQERHKTLLGLIQSTGGVNIIRFGAGPNGLTRTLGQYMVGSAATFGYVFYSSTKAGFYERRG